MLKKCLNVLYWSFLGCLALISLMLFLSNLDSSLKYRIFSVQSGSMYPTIPMGSLLLVTPSDNYTVGDIVTFRQNFKSKQTTTHRISKVKRDSNLRPTKFNTKGDANKTEDINELLYTNIIGKAVLWIPFIGYPLIFAKTLLGFILLIVVPSTIIVYSELISIKSELKSMFHRKKIGKEEISSLF